MKPDVEVFDIDNLAKGVDEEKARKALHIAAYRIREAMYETEAMEETHAQHGSNEMYFVGRLQGLNKALCSLYIALKECLQEE